MSTLDAENFRWDPEFDDIDTGAFTLPTTPVRAAHVAGAGGYLPDLRPVPVRHRRMPVKARRFWKGFLVVIGSMVFVVSLSVMAVAALALAGGWLP